MLCGPASTVHSEISGSWLPKGEKVTNVCFQTGADRSENLLVLNSRHSGFMKQMLNEIIFIFVTLNQTEKKINNIKITSNVEITLTAIT